MVLLRCKGMIRCARDNSIIFIFVTQSSRYTKMEKADILEMAVKHLKALRETVNSKFLLV